MKDASILVYGSDMHLLETRRWVLESAGFKVAEADDLAEMERIAAEQPIKLMVLCHSLSLAETRSAAEWAQRRKPALQCLLLLTSNSERPSDLQGERVSTAGGPAGLIAAVKKTLAQQERMAPAA